jgi:chemotaxis regulatin CheY-phosphate phosphatase CheZ
MEIKLTNNQQEIKQYFEPLYQRSLSDSEVKEISNNIRGFLLVLCKIEKENKNVKTERI